MSWDFAVLVERSLNTKDERKSRVMLYFIVNQTSSSGGSHSVWERVKRHLEEKQASYEAWITEYEGHAAELAAKISKLPEQEVSLIVVGGDGTINEVINGIQDFERVRFGVIPSGSGNDFCRGIQMSGSPEELVDHYLHNEKESRIDLGNVFYGDGASDEWSGSRLFAISSGFGMDAIVCKEAEHSRLKKILNKFHMGSLTYVLITIYTLFRMGTVTVKAGFSGAKPSAAEFQKLIFVAAMNFRAEGGGVPMAPSADATDGKLSVCCVHGIPKWRTFFCLPLLVMAKHEWLKGFDIVNCESCTMEISSPFTLHVDGEYVGEVTKVKYESLHEKLRLLW